MSTSATQQTSTSPVDVFPSGSGHRSSRISSMPSQTRGYLAVSSAQISSPGIQTVRLASPRASLSNPSSSPSVPAVDLAPQRVSSPFTLLSQPAQAQTNMSPNTAFGNLPLRFPLGNPPVLSQPMPPPVSSLVNQRTTTATVSSSGTPFCLSNVLASQQLGTGSLPLWGNMPATQRVAPAPGLDFRPFLVGPGFPPLPPKTVGSIISGAFIDLTSLVDESIETELPSFSLVDNQLVLRRSKKVKDFQSVTSWLEAFTLYVLVVTSYYPHRVTDLLRYSLLILRTSQQFPGRGWLAYDLAFRKDAAARGLTDWSHLNAELFHFHVSAEQVQSRAVTPTITPRFQPVSTSPASATPNEPPGDERSYIICKSWNWGFCSSPRNQCRFRHICDYPHCLGKHRRLDVHSSAGRTPFRRSVDKPPFRRDKRAGASDDRPR